MKDNDIKPQNCNGVYGSDIPDNLCYQWAEDYFYDPDAPEDKDEKEEKFVPKPYAGKISSKSTKKKVDSKKANKKAPEKKSAELKSAENTSTDSKAIAEAEKNCLSGQMSFLDFLMPNTKAS